MSDTSRATPIYRALFISPTPALSPLLQSQGIPHMRELSGRGIEFTLLTFETGNWSDSDWERARQLKASLAVSGIEWHILRFAETRIPWVPNSTVDIVRGAWHAAHLVHEKNIEVVHCRSYVPAYMMLLVRRIRPVKFIFDMRGFLPDEYVENGYWNTRMWQYRLAKWLEAQCLRTADSVVVTCQGMLDKLRASYAGQDNCSALVEQKTTVIPNCADLERFRPNQETRVSMRKRYGLGGKTVLLWLVGGIKRWHRPYEIVRFFLHCKSVFNDAYLLVLSNSTDVHKILRDAGLSRDDYLAISAAPERVHEFVLMGDCGLTFLDPSHPASAVKVGEYLGSGLPVVVDAGQSELASLLTGTRTGVVVKSFTEEAYHQAAIELFHLLTGDASVCQRCRAAAEANFSLRIAVDKYYEVYRNVLGKR